MSSLDSLLAQLPMNDIAAKLGVDAATAQSAVQAALPALLGGLGANAQDPAGAASIEKALSRHDGSLVEGGVDLAAVDPVDGEKIVSHVFGSNEQQVVSALGQSTGGGAGLMSKLLPILAPIVMSFLAGKFLGGRSGAPEQNTASAPASNDGGIGDLLGSVLGGGGVGGGASSGGGLGDLLGGLLGGGKSSGGGGGLGDLLGGLLGGGRR